MEVVVSSLIAAYVVICLCYYVDGMLIVLSAITSHVRVLQVRMTGCW